MLFPYNPPTTVKQASVQAGLTVSELKKTDIETSHRGSNTLYVNNLLLAAHIELNGGQVERYEEAVAEALLKAKVESVMVQADVVLSIDNQKLPSTFQAKYHTKMVELKASMSIIMDNLLSVSDKEYYELLKKPLGEIVNAKEIRQLIEMREGDTAKFQNHSNQEIKAMAKIIKKFNKNNSLLKKLHKIGFSNDILDKYFEQDSDTLQGINNEGFKFDITDDKNKAYYEFFKTYKSIKEDYETKIDYPLEKSVIAEIEAKYRKKFHIDLLDKGGK